MSNPSVWLTVSVLVVIAKEVIERAFRKLDKGKESSSQFIEAAPAAIPNPGNIDRWKLRAFIVQGVFMLGLLALTFIFMAAMHDSRLDHSGLSGLPLIALHVGGWSAWLTLIAFAVWAQQIIIVPRANVKVTQEERIGANLVFWLIIIGSGVVYLIYFD